MTTTAPRRLVWREITSRLIWDTEEMGPEGYRYILVRCSYPHGDSCWMHSIVFPLSELEQARNPDIYVGNALIVAQTFMVNAIYGMLQSTKS